MKSDFTPFKFRCLFYLPFAEIGLNVDSLLKVPIGSELLPMSELEAISEITEDTLKSTVAKWEETTKDTDFEKILNAKTE
jgi:hypothetical protein